MLTNEEMIEGVSKLSEDGFEDIQQLKSEMENHIIEEENESDVYERSPGRDEPRPKHWQTDRPAQNQQQQKEFTSLAEINRMLAESSESLIDPDHVQTIPVKRVSIGELPQNLDKMAVRRLAFNSSIEQSAR